MKLILVLIIRLVAMLALFFAGTYYIQGHKWDEKFLMGFEPVYRHYIGGEPMR